MVQPECLKDSECPDGVCINGKCKSEKLPLYSRCAHRENCANWDNDQVKVDCEHGYCLRDDYKYPTGNINCRKDYDCKNKGEFCYKNKCITYQTNISDSCNDKNKRCSEDLACYANKCREKCWVERDGEEDEGGCSEAGKVCRKLKKFSYFNVCLPKGMAIAKEDVSKPSTTTPTPTTPQPTPTEPAPKTTSDDSIFKGKAVWLVGGVAGLLSVIVIIIISIMLVKKRSRRSGL